MKEFLRQKWDALKYRILMAFVLLVAVAVIVAEGVVAGLKKIGRKVKTKFARICVVLNEVKQVETKED